MLKFLVSNILLFIDEESGQGITEYGAILAFVAVLVAFVFVTTSGGLKSAVSNAFSTMTSTINSLNSGASSGSS